MTAKKTTTRHHELPGTVYLNKNRYWYKVQLPGEAKPAARPLVPHGSNIHPKSGYGCRMISGIDKCSSIMT